MGKDTNLCHYFIFVIKNKNKYTHYKYTYNTNKINSALFLCFVVLALKNKNAVILWFEMIWVELPQTRNAFYNLKHSRLVRKKLDVCAHTIYKKNIRLLYTHWPLY